MAFNITEEQVALTEEELGRKLPPIYRQTMMANNGGTAFTEDDQWELHPIRDSTDRKRLSRSCNHILVETTSAQQWREFPKEALAIGGNGMGDVMILLPSPSDSTCYADQVFVYWHEAREVKALANDLSAFEIE